MASRSKRTNRRRSIRKLFKSGKFLSLLLLVLFAILALGAYLVLQPSFIRSVLGIALANPTQVGNPSTPTRSTLAATPTVTATKSAPVRVESDWKDYSTPAYGYALKYPSNMVYREYAPAKDLLQSVSFYLAKDSNLPPYQIPEITVSIFANPESLGTVDWLTAHQKPMDSSVAFFEGVIDVQSVLVGGQTATGFEEKPPGSAGAHRVIIARNKQVFSILVTDVSGGNLRETYSAILSTIRWSTPRP